MSRKTDLRVAVENQINDIINDLNKLKNLINGDFYDGLGGALQNTWDLYFKLGALSELDRMRDKDK